MSCGCDEIGRHVGFRFQCESVQVQVLSSAPEQTEIEPDIHFCKRCCGFYLCKVRKKHKVKCLVLFSYEIFIVLKWFIINLILELNDLLCQ